MRSSPGRFSRRGGAMLRGGVALALLIATDAGAAEERSPAGEVAYERGAHALRLGDAEKAVIELARAVAENPDDPEALNLYARALLLAERPAKAVEVLEHLRGLEPESPDLEFLMGLAFFRLEDWPRAREHLTLARDVDPRNARARLLLGIAHQVLEEDEAAEAELRQAATLDPSLNAQVAYRLGLIAMGRREVAEARRLFEQTITEAPDSPLANTAASRIRALGGGDVRPWSAYVASGAQYDTNVNLGGGGDTFVVSSESDYAALFEGGASARVLERDRFDLRVGYRGYLLAHRDVKDLDVEANRGWVTAGYVFSDSVRGRMTYELDWAWADFESFYRTQAIEPAVEWIPYPMVLVRALYRYADRAFFREDVDPALDRDGHVQTLGADLYWRLPELVPWGESFARLGLLYRSEDPQGDEYESRGPAAIASLTVALPSESLLTLEGWFERRSFDNPSIFEAGGDRSDRITQLRLLLRRALGPHLWLDAEYRFVHWGSNVETYDFDRHLYQMRLGYTF